MEEFFKKMKYFERRLSKSLKMLTLFSPSNSILFNEQNHEKQKKPETSDQSLIRLQNKFRKIT